MKATLVRELDIHFQCFDVGRKVVAAQWWAFVPAKATAEQHKIFLDKATVVPTKSRVVNGEPCICYSFGDHSEGALSVAWCCFEAAMRLECQE